MLQHHFMIILLKNASSIHYNKKIFFHAVIESTQYQEDENNPNQENNQLDLCMQTNLCVNSHGNSANTGPTTNDHCDQTPKDTAVPVAEHIVNAAQPPLLTFRRTISEQ